MQQRKAYSSLSDFPLFCFVFFRLFMRIFVMPYFKCSNWLQPIASAILVLSYISKKNGSLFYCPFFKVIKQCISLVKMILSFLL